MKKQKNNPSKKLIYALAAHWGKDHRTIKAWFKKDDPMLTHPESQKIISQFLIPSK